jgi:hypothetical protein
MINDFKILVHVDEELRAWALVEGGIQGLLSFTCMRTYNPSTMNAVLAGIKSQCTYNLNASNRAL